MNILILFTYGVSLKDWYDYGIISREIALYNNLLKKNTNIKFLTFGNYTDLNFLKDSNKIDIIPVFPLIKSRIPKFHFIKSLVLPFKLKKILRNIDLIKTNQIQGSWIACIAKILFKKKIIIRGGYDKLCRHILLYERKGPKSYFKYLVNYFWIFVIELIAYKLADGIILTNKADINFIIKCFKLKKKLKHNKIRHFYNYIDTELFKPLGLHKTNKNILFIGRLERQKNLFELINAFKDLKEVKLDIIGSGSYLNRLKAKCKELNIKVNFSVKLPNYEIPKIINQYQILVLPSLWEGNPKVLLEAMSCGLSCIGSNIPGINNVIIHKENGYLCGLDSNSIKNAILAVNNNEPLKKNIGINARKFIVNNCSLKKLTNAEYLFYQDILYS